MIYDDRPKSGCRQHLPELTSAPERGLCQAIGFRAFLVTCGFGEVEELARLRVCGPGPLMRSVGHKPCIPDGGTCLTDFGHRKHGSSGLRFVIACSYCLATTAMRLHATGVRNVNTRRRWLLSEFRGICVCMCARDCVCMCARGAGPASLD